MVFMILQAFFMKSKPRKKILSCSNKKKVNIKGKTRHENFMKFSKSKSKFVCMYQILVALYLGYSIGSGMIFRNGTP